MIVLNVLNQIEKILLKCHLGKVVKMFLAQTVNQTLNIVSM